MIKHYYTLVKLVEELRTLVGSELVECFTQDKNTLVIVLFDGKSEHHLFYSGDTRTGGLYLRENFARARKNTYDIFGEIVGETLQAVQLEDKERIVKLVFINTIVEMFLFGGSRSNVIIHKTSGGIITAFKHSRDIAGNAPEPYSSTLMKLEEFPPDTKLVTALSKCDMLCGKYYAEEICYRGGYSPDMAIGDLSQEAINDIKSRANDLMFECYQSKQFYLLKTQVGTHLMSLIPLAKYPDVEYSYNSISKAIEECAVQTMRDIRYNSIYGKIKNFLEREKSRQTKKISGFAELELGVEREALYKLRAELLYSCPNPKDKAGEMIQLKDYEGNDITIPLDKKKTLLENAERYFEKSRNTRREMKIRKERLPQIIALIEKYNDALEKLETAKTVKELEKLESFADYEFGMSVAENRPDAESRFRTFDLGEGFFLYVGKNAANNDELTTSFAKQNDLWFHARGIGGSHAVLRIEKNQKPTKQIIKKAAEITAYYSQARKAKYIPVAYTFKKYVRKPKGVNTGTVMLEREEVVMVEPKLPEGQREKE